MKHLEDDAFLADWDRLTPRERGLCVAAVRAINEAFERRQGGLPRWPARLRVRRMSGHSSIFEMTWSFAGPDGRATFELVDLGGEPAIKWRRIGGHEIFTNP